MTGGTPFSSQSSQKSSESEPRLSVSRSHLEDDGSEPRPQHLQASHSSDSGPLGSLGLSHGSPVAWEYLPFFRTYGKLLAVEEPASWPQVCRDRGGDQNTPEDLEPPSGFFPHYRSKEESFPCLGLPGGSCQSSQDLRLTKEALVGCFCRLTGSCRLSWQAQMLSPGPYIHHPAAPSCCSRQGAPVTAARLSPSPVMLPSGAKPFVPQDSCLTTEPQRRSYTPALGLPPLHRGAGGPQGSCPGLVQP
ncbi:uncharacterized protein LOC119863907 isoform X2 [Canis lupus familiaris]|uniref:uncharacterized protein LOC119863907 isoform X2 n=1 Tax=Canis lupus familiaris TaxID=9615 RepID=UPI0003AE2901|nr:uncharacterized protein LOC119863907 isoform X2 [Canis lupus familiaris]|eukprot:XP_005626619.1 uncharacterized protein LOC102152433 isoform X2 [Canis lupus familiaris]